MPHNPTKKLPPKAHRSATVSGATIERIIDAAQQVLITQGSVGFSMRRVAEAAAISPGNLTYHFPSKGELLQAVVTQLVKDFTSQFEGFLAESESSTGQELQTLVRWLLTDAITAQTMRISRELWAMALHDTAVQAAFDDLYDILMEKVVQLLRRSQPNADETSLREMVLFLGLISEGSIVLYGTRRERTVPFERAVELTISVLGTLAPELQVPVKSSKATLPD